MIEMTKRLEKSQSQKDCLLNQLKNLKRTKVVKVLKRRLKKSFFRTIAAQLTNSEALLQKRH
jgi:hypothetical protein